MTREQLLRCWRADLYRYDAETSTRALLKRVVAHPGYRYTFAMRLCAYLRGARPRPVYRPLELVSKLWLRRLRHAYGIDVPASTRVGPGLYINHPGGIVVHNQATIGANCNLSHGVTLGESNRGPRKGFPVVGDGVYIGPGAKLVGAVHVGDDVAVGANCVVTSDVPDHAVVAGVPGRVISQDGAAGYVNRTDWDR
jgi:serine O-acetyltransferase